MWCVLQVCRCGAKLATRFVQLCVVRWCRVRERGWRQPLVGRKDTQRQHTRVPPLHIVIVTTARDDLQRIDSLSTEVRERGQILVAIHFFLDAQKILLVCLGVCLKISKTVRVPN